MIKRPFMQRLVLVWLLFMGVFAGFRIWSVRLANPVEAFNPRDPLLWVDINHASEHELALLPGIGPVAARAIVADRNIRGPYQSVDELTRVRGIGKKRVEGVRRYTLHGQH